MATVTELSYDDLEIRMQALREVIEKLEMLQDNDDLDAPIVQSWFYASSELAAVLNELDERELDGELDNA